MPAPLSLGRRAWQPSPARLAILLSGPSAITIAAWIYLGVMIGDMPANPGMSSMMTAQPLAIEHLFGLFVMWVVMMAAMMLPTAAPMIKMYARMQSTDRARGVGWLPVLAFSGGYVLSWIGFSVVAAGLQASLTEFSVVSPMMKTVSGPVTGIILVSVGVYQFTPLKQSCLRQCQSPFSFFMTQWREGAWGALAMGGRHGLYCVGCCWAIMGLLFVTGVMSAAWIVAITAYVLVEKIAPQGQTISRFTGACMMIAGFWILL